MVGEIVQGAMTGVTQGMSAVAMEMPVTVAQNAVASVAEAAAPLTQTVTQSLTESSSVVAGSMGLQMPQVASSVAEVTEAVVGVQEQVGAQIVTESVTEAVTGTSASHTQGLDTQIEGLLSEGADVEDVMAGLSEGLLTGIEDMPTATLMEEAQRMGEFSNEQLADLFAVVDTTDIPKEMLDDPAFREDVSQNLFEQANTQHEGITKREDMMEMIRNSAQAAKKSFAERQETAQSKEHTPATKEELEDLKRKAAMEAVKRQMDTWRQSVMADKRLNEDAKQIAMKKINNVETRLLLQTQMKWDGKSLMKMMMVAALWLAE